MNPRKTGALASYAYAAAQVIVNLLYVPLLLNGIGQSEYGLYQMIGSLMAYLTIIGSTLSVGITRYYCAYFAANDTKRMAETLAAAKRIYSIASVLAIGITILLAGAFQLLYAPILSSYEMQESLIILGVLALNVVITMHNTINVAVINTHEKFAFLKLTQLASVALQPVIVFIAISFIPNALTVCIVQLGMNALCAFVQRRYARRNLRATIAPNLTGGNITRGLLGFSWAILLVTIADQIFWKTNQLILGFLYGTEAVAVYSVALQVLMAYLSLGIAISSVFMPKISELYLQRDHQAIAELFIQIGRLSFFVLFLVLSLFAVFGQDFMVLWAGEGYQEASVVALIIMVPLTIDLVQNLGIVIMQVMDRYLFRGITYLVAALCNVALTIILAARFGIIGAAVATGISMFISNGLVMNVYYQACIKLPIKTFWKNIARIGTPLCIPLLGSLGARCWLTLDESWLVFVGSIFAYCLMYALITYAFAMNARERELVKSLVPTLSKRKSRSTHHTRDDP
ncbi:MAG: oligosaccharide flippase family protein [Gordonibacter sp.]